jgi:hypothetical protein
MHSGRMSTWGLRRTASALAVAAAVAGVGGAAIAAATDGNHHTFGGSMHGTFGGFGGPPPPPAAHRSDDDLDSMHGEYVVADGHGGFRTLMTQTGRVTAISADSVTARSDDGFTATYVIRGSGGAAKPPFKVDDHVVIRATREGEIALVTTMAPPLSAGH